MTFLVDANVLSEATKPEPDQDVIAWLRKHQRQLAVNPVVLGELEYGIRLLPPGPKRRRLEAWFKDGSRRLKVLDFDAVCSSEWARLLARLRKSGHAMPVKDSLVAATALAHGLTVVTRNTRDFEHAGVRLHNPFKD